MPTIHRTTEYSAKTAGYQSRSCAQSMPEQFARMSAQTMCGIWAAASVAASILLIQTDVSASVSFFLLLITLCNLLLVSLIGLLSLAGLLSLSGLTGLFSDLVGLMRGLSPGTTTGD